MSSASSHIFSSEPHSSLSKPPKLTETERFFYGNLGLSCGVVLEKESRQTQIQNLDLIIIMYYAEPRGALANFLLPGHNKNIC